MSCASPSCTSPHSPTSCGIDRAAGMAPPIDRAAGMHRAPPINRAAACIAHRPCMVIAVSTALSLLATISAVHLIDLEVDFFSGLHPEDTA
jgi:hypothetical protein